MLVGMCVADELGIKLIVGAKLVTKIWSPYNSTFLNLICVRSRSKNGFTVSKLKMSS